ncbi:MAG: FAD-dependent oxidoreductase [Planctomycetes bacterium]|nr:FAD-dependent oxidoreductase [Planctomycetota bacterium]
MSENKKKIGSVVVVGGGVGGMQASLDLAESGYKVHLIEQEPCIGGTMAQLDKTFPTNDCAMCTLAPRLVDTGSHLNIDRITDAEVEKIEGEPGNFKVTINKKARYIDLDKCTGCSLCVEKCPVKVDSEFDTDLIKRNAIYRRYPQAVPGAFSIDKEGVSPCRFACPANVNAHAYVVLIAQGRYAEALEVERRDNPFPSICGRICPHPCEFECTRNELDEPVSIAVLKRFLADWEAAHPDQKPPVPQITQKDERVAIIGAGPAGLMAARELRLRGYQVTMFESLPEAGGMLRYGIPSYRLPKEVIKQEVQNAVLDLGVELKTNVALGKDVTIDSLKKQGFKAIFIAIGAWQGLKLNIPGENDFSGVIDAVSLLRNLNLDKPDNIKGKRVAVIGGGNVAMDAARSAWRLGASEVNIVYRRSRNEMPANPWEIEEAIEEGIKITFLAAPTKVLGEGGKVTKLECIKMELSEPDASGRRRPVALKGSEFTIAIDVLIPAISQQPELEAVKGSGIKNNPMGLFEVDTITLETAVPGIFAGGDAVSGPATAIESIESGRRAAVSIDRYLKGEDLKMGREEPERTKTKKDIEGIEKKPRVKMPRLPVAQRVGNFKEVELGYTEEQAKEEASRCLSCSVCCECLLCVAACGAKAVNHDMVKEEKQIINTGAVILAPGFELFDAEKKKELGFDRYDNVVTALQFERIMSASGPYTGQILRPSDKKHPKKIGFIQCVGSREVDHNYCSSVCCMYATKEAIIAKEHQQDLECHIFYIDIRAFGKGFEQYYERAKEQGIKYTRCKPSAIREIPATKNLLVTYYDEKNQKVEEEFDIVVLSCGLNPPASVRNLAKTFNIELNKHGFCQTTKFTPVETNRPGIYACGPFTEPKDIPETVMQSSGAASKAMMLLSEARGTLISKREYPSEMNVTGQEPRIGVFVCHCGKNIGGVADVPAIRDYAKTLANVVYVEDSLYTCSSDTQKKIKEMIKEHNLNRLVVASCTPRTHEPLFRNTCREAGLNPYLFEMANIRDQNTWVHMFEPAKATQKAKDLVRMAVAKSRMLEPLYNRSLDVEHDALVIGGGASGMTSALELANQGFTTHLVERSEELGGQMKHLYYMLEESYKPQDELTALISKVSTHPKIKLYTSTNVKVIEGSMGNFKTTLETPKGEVVFKHGTAVVATGAEEYKPKEYLYGQDSMVITQVKFEEKIARKTNIEPHTQGSYVSKPQLVGAASNPDLDKVNSVVMIQCVGSRDKEHPYCSRICCSMAIKNALRFKKFKPEAPVYVLYRDIRSYGFNEEYYRNAREQGVVFLRHNDDEKPEVARKNGKLTVTITDPIINQRVMLETDLIVLSAGTVAEPGNEELAKKLKVPLTADKFFLEAHMKLRPVDFATEGVYLCGLAHSPKNIDESIIQACGAASRSSTILGKDRIELDAIVSEVVDENCDGCAYCVDPCPYHALALIEYARDGAIKKTIDRDLALCKGCGVCQATCPKGGIVVNNFKLPQIQAMVAAALESSTT